MNGHCNGMSPTPKCFMTCSSFCSSEQHAFKPQVHKKYLLVAGYSHCMNTSISFSYQHDDAIIVPWHSLHLCHNLINNYFLVWIFAVIYKPEKGLKSYASSITKTQITKWGFETGPSFLFVLPEAGANKVRWVLTNKVVLRQEPKFLFGDAHLARAWMIHTNSSLRRNSYSALSHSSDAVSKDFIIVFQNFIWRWFRAMLPILQICSSHVSIGAYYISVRPAIFGDILAYFVTS